MGFESSITVFSNYQRIQKQNGLFFSYKTDHEFANEIKIFKKNTYKCINKHWEKTESLNIKEEENILKPKQNKKFDAKKNNNPKVF